MTDKLSTDDRLHVKLIVYAFVQDTEEDAISFLPFHSDVTLTKTDQCCDRTAWSTTLRRDEYLFGENSKRLDPFLEDFVMFEILHKDVIGPTEQIAWWDRLLNATSRTTSIFLDDLTIKMTIDDDDNQLDIKVHTSSL